MHPNLPHQYVDRRTSRIRTEKLIGDRALSFLYSSVREKAPFLFRALTSAHASEVLGFLNYDLPLGDRLTGARNLVQALGIDLSECVDPPESLTTPRSIFERRIRYWELRPLPDPPRAVVSPADSRMLIGSLAESSLLFLKEKFFAADELLAKSRWSKAFQDGDFAVCRLTPEKYHYNHTPVAGTVIDHFELEGAYHSCNPGAVLAAVTPYSKNKRVVTIIDSDVPGGTGVGLVAMVEVVALMIGKITQAYSECRYEAPRGIEKGMFLCQGCPKSLYQPGSSVDVLLFQKGRIEFSADIRENARRRDVASRFAQGLGKPLVETEVQVRSEIAKPKGAS